MLRETMRRLEAATEIATLLSDRAAPHWLATFFYNAIFDLQFVRDTDKIIPNRTELLSRLLRMSEATELILGELSSPAVQDLLPPPALGRVDDHELGHALLGLARRLESAGSAAALRTPDGKLIRGAGRAHSGYRLPPELVCAGTAIEAYRFVQRREPPPGGVKVAEVAEKLWQAAGHESRAVVGKPLAIWRPRFLQILGKTKSNQRAEAIEKLCSEVRLRLLEILGRQDGQKGPQASPSE